MKLEIRRVNSIREIYDFVRLPWKIYKNDPHWVPPLVVNQISKLDPDRNPFWKTAVRELWMVKDNGIPVGTIAAIIDHKQNDQIRDSIGTFGFFESINNENIARLLLNTAEEWLQKRGMTKIRGPYNPSSTDETGILIEGFESRPSLLEAHHPRYYHHFFIKNGYKKHSDLVARLLICPEGVSEVQQVLPEKLIRVAALAEKRTDVLIRKFNPQKWDDEMKLACELYNKGLNNLPQFVPISIDEFNSFAEGFRSILDSDLALVAEIKGIPVAFALALPDISEALQKANGKLSGLGLVKFWLASRNLKRASFKILIVNPNYHGRGIEALLIVEVSKALLRKGFREADLSMTGDENEKSNRFQENLGMKVYRRYRIFEKKLRGQLNDK
jgi:GNAT superfamily N-acetyltransferase